MLPYDEVRFSRPLATAQTLGEAATDRHRFLRKRVLLTGEPQVLGTANGRACLLDSLRLLIRICPNITVVLPESCADLVAVCHMLIDPLSFGGTVSYSTDCGALDAYDAILSVGTDVRPTLPWTVINAHGWLAHVSSGTMPLPGTCDQSNPIAALAAAALGVTEVFKRLVRLKPSRGPLLDGLSFSLFDYQVGTSDPGPPVPDDLSLDLLLVGVGAIGNGIAYLLSQLPITGRVLVVDGQCYGDENLGTCLCIGPADVGSSKALFAEKLLSPRLAARGFAEDLTAFADHLGTAVPYPRVVLGAVDNVPARHAIQRLWPDLIIDGAIGDFGCQVSRHPWGEDIACLMCMLRDRPGEPAEQVASRMTGLRADRARQELESVTEEDVRAAPADKQAWLTTRVGHTLCSVIQEALAQHLSQEQQRSDFAPSVPFVACLSASMVVAELIKSEAPYGTVPAVTEPRLQFDVLRGPERRMLVEQARRLDCPCVTRRRNIERARRRRSER